MDKLIDELKNMLVKAKLYTYEKLNKMGDVTIQAKFMEHFEILETTNILKKKEIYYIPRHAIKTLLVKNKAFQEILEKETFIFIGTPQQPDFRGFEQNDIGWIRLDNANLVKEER